MVNFYLSKIETSSKNYNLSQASNVLFVSDEFLLRMLEMGIIYYTGKLSNPRIPVLEIERFVQIKNIHDDLNVNWTGSAMIVDLINENSQLKQELLILKKKWEDN